MLHVPPVSTTWGTHRKFFIKYQGECKCTTCTTSQYYLSTFSSLKLSVLLGGTHRRFVIKHQGNVLHVSPVSTTCLPLVALTVSTTCLPLVASTCQYYLSTSSSLKLSVLPGGTHRRFFIKYQGKCTASTAVCFTCCKLTYLITVFCHAVFIITTLGCTDLYE